MVDLSNYKARLETARQNAVVDYDNPREAFVAEMLAAGFKPPSNLVLDKLMRIDDPQDKKGKGTGWYVYHEFENEGRVLGVGNYGTWRGNPEKVAWCSRSTNGMSLAEKMEYNRQIESASLKRAEEQKVINAEAAAKAFEIWENASDATDEHPYLARKQVGTSAGVRISRGNLVVPVCLDEQITSLQFILPAKNADGKDKFFLSGGRTRGCYFVIEGASDAQVFVAEGYSTAKTVNMATNCSVYVAFNAGNLYEVAVIAKNKHHGVRVTICGDDDRETAGNPGRTKAKQAADGLGLGAVFPESADGTAYVDFNDLHVAHGIAAVKDCIYARPKAYQPKQAANDALDIYTPAGILGEIINYYNTTSGNNQPGFAVQAAITCCSVILARNFATNFNNRTSLFLMCIGKSGTGKEHPKLVLEAVLEATGNGHLISGDGYTSGAAVMSALQERPRHVTVIDELAKYLQAANNKFGNSHMQEANSQLMQAIGRLDGTMRAKAYATIGATKERKTELANQRVVNPAVTLLGMATPDDMFATIDVSAVKDGFLNRFIICVSDAERQVRQHKERLDVPQSIIEWGAKIRSRHGDTIETAQEAPALKTLVFTAEAMALQDEFQKYCVEVANSLDNFGMAEISGRSNEMAMRLALIVALSRDAMAEVIEADDLRWSIAWIKHNLRVLINHMKLSVASSEHEGFKKELLKALRLRGESGVTWAQMQKQNPFSKHKPKELKEMLTALRDGNLAIDEPYQSGGKGRPTIIWRAIE